jgi:hypothetical protein
MSTNPPMTDEDAAALALYFKNNATGVPVPAPVKRQRFTTWLRQQAKREDPVGDLARDYVEDCRRRQVRMTTAELRRTVRYHGCLPAWWAFCEAMGEYLASRRVQPS